MQTANKKPVNPHISLSSFGIMNLLLLAVGYRFPMMVTEVLILRTVHGKTGYYVCPRCGVTMEREFSSFCDRCGQHLCWKNYRKAKAVFPKSN